MSRYQRFIGATAGIDDELCNMFGSTVPREVDSTLDDFSGSAPLFPLPNIVLFPQALLPLQIFEPRYRQMTADALEGERMIAMGLLLPGWEQLPSSAVPPIYPIVGLGKIIAHEKLEDGRYYLILRGVARAKVLREKQADLPYRIGELEIYEDIAESTISIKRQDRIDEIVSLFVRLFPQVNIQQLFLQSISELPLATVCDVLLGSIPMATERAQLFLEELDADERSRMLLDLLEQGARRGVGSLQRAFPPDFSVN